MADPRQGDLWQAHRAATAEYAAASAAYEAAAMSGDRGAMVEADRRLRSADAACGETAAALLRTTRRRELPSFEEMLAHPWTQVSLGPPTAGDSVVYSDVPDATVALPFRPGAAPTQPPSDGAA